MSVKILVVDDSASDCLIIKNTLSNYSILTACDGVDAMRQIDEDEEIDLVLLNLNIPNMDGFQVLNKLKSNDRYNKLRTIILSNYDELDNETKGLELGAVDYIRKPIHKDSLRTRIDIHVELIRVQQLLEQKMSCQSYSFDTIFHQAPIGIAISYEGKSFKAGSNDIVSINPMFEQITGITKEELISLGWAKITHPDDLEEEMKNYMKLQSEEIKRYSMEKRYIKPDGSIVWVHIVVASLALSRKNAFNYICMIQDISKRKEIEKALTESERNKSVLLSHLPGMAYRCNYDREWTMQFVSAGCFELTGYTPKNLLYNKDISFNRLIAPEYRDPLWKEWEHILSKRLPFKYEYEIITAKGEKKWVLEMGQGIYNEQGLVVALEGIILDISDRKKIENNLVYNNEHEIWTGLYNRRSLENLLRDDAKMQTVEKRAVVGINLSAIHLLSMNYGYRYSQELIKKIADALKSHCNEKRLLFNTYENRFVFYVKAYKGKKELITFCEAVSNTLESLLAIERISGGIGVVELNRDNEHDTDQILKSLLIASERAIDINDCSFSFCFYDTEIERQMIREQDIKHKLTIIASDENDAGLFLQYQPILDLQSNQICGFEALARLKSDKLGLVTPLEFIPIAEETKLIIEVGKKIILQAFCFLSKLKENGYSTVNVSINISAIQLLEKNFCKNLFVMINEIQINPENICLEITESIFASNYQEINKILNELKEFGLKIAIDDFGTGYSSIARERGLNVNCLKIDKYFIDNLLLINPDEAITGDIVSMAHKLGHFVVAEGVEHEKQRQYLINCGCDKIQGYLISKPLDEEMAIDMLKKQN